MSTALAEKIEQLHPEEQQQVEIIIEQMLKQKTTSSPKQWKFDWEGALKDMRNEFTSVELQHSITKLWRQSVSR